MLPSEQYGPDQIRYLIIDLFAGAGGTTLGFEKALDSLGRKFCKVISAVNHDHTAIKSHWKNWPEVYHFNEDITKMYGFVKHGMLFQSPEMLKLVRLVNLYKAFYPNAKLILWASLECTNFSNAKGGASRDADSRTLACHLDRYIATLDPDMIMIENVREFRSWGPLKIRHKKIKDKSKNWVSSELIRRYDKKTKQKEYAWQPIEKMKGVDWLRWKQDINDRFGYHDDWRELDSANFGAYTSRNRLFGLFVKRGEQFVWPNATHAKNPSTGNLFESELLPWNAVRPCLNLDVKGKSIIYRKKKLVDNTLKRHYNGLIKHVAGMTPSEFEKTFYVEGKIKPGYCIPKEDVFLANYHGTGHNTISTDNPSGALVAADIHSIVFIDHQYSGEKNHQSIDHPLWALTQNPSAAKMDVEFIGGFIHNPGWFGCDTSLDKPSPVIVARQDKAPLSLIMAESGYKIHVIHASDSPITKKIKEFMNLFRISDIKMRMLEVIELKRIQGFPEEYYLAGKKTAQKKFIGNSVQPDVVDHWIRAIDNEYDEELMAA